MRFSALIGISAGVAAVAHSLGCASGSTSPATAAETHGQSHAAELWSNKCGSCHVPVEPGSRSRAALEAAMQRHRARAKLTADEWAQIVDFLAAPRRGAPDTSRSTHRRAL